MRRLWPEEFASLLDGAEEVEIEIPAAAREDGSHGEATHRRAWKVRIAQQDYERIWPLAEMRYRLAGKHTGKAVTLIANNPHYHDWHPADGGSDETAAENGQRYKTKYLVVHFLVDDVTEAATAA